MRGGLNLQQRVAILVVAAILPLAALSLWVALRETRSVGELSQSQLKFSASLIAANQDRTIESTQMLLEAIVAMPDLRNAPRDRCQAYFAQLKSRNPVYLNIGFLDAQGRSVCHANGSVGDFSAADRSYFQDALAQRRFVMGEEFVGRAAGVRTVPFGLPMVEDGQVTGVAFATLNLDNAAAALAKLELPERARVVIADRRGQVVMEYPPRDGMALPRRLTTPQLIEAARAPYLGTGEVIGSAGGLRLFAFAPTRPVGTRGWLAIASIDGEGVAASSAASLRNQLAVMALMLLVGLGLAWAIGGRAIVRPARQIVGAVNELERGNLDVRLPGTRRAGAGEFARIAAAFNLMAQSLQSRQADLQSELGRSQTAYAMLDQVLNGMQEALVVVDADGEFLMYNEAARALFPVDGPRVPMANRPREWGLYRRDRQTLFNPEDLPVTRALRGGRGRHLALYVKSERVPQGRMLICSWQPVLGPTGITGALVLFTDVTELERLEAEQLEQLERLRETQRKLVEAQRIGRVGNWELDLASGRLGWSDGVFQLFGLSPETFEPSLQSFERLVHPHDRALLKPARDAALRDGRVMRLEYRIVKPGGAVAWMYEIGEARRGEGGGPVWFGGVIQDITDRKASEQALRERERQLQELNAGLEQRIAERTAELARQELLYRSLAEQAPEVVWNTDASGDRLTFLNDAWYELAGGTPADWLGKSGLAAVHPDDREAVSENWQRSRRELVPFVGVRRLLAKDGTYHTMSYKGTPVFDADGQVAFWVGIDADITQFKAIERALRRSNEELEAFSYSVSHDLRAPLGAIGGFSKALAGKIEGVADEKARHYLARIQAGVGKMEQLIDALLQLSKVTRAPLNYASVDLAAMAREAVDALQEQAPQRVVEVRIEPGLAAQGDARLLRLVLDNLLGNAWKFTSQMERAVIEVGRREGDGTFFVRDNGVGFDMGYATKLFGAFQRLHTEAEFPGTGIGLATVKRIVTRHQGNVWAESAPGEGTTFYFTLGEGEPPAWAGTQL